MENEIIKIKCSSCGAVLAVKNQSGIENKKLTCPVCKESAPFKNFKPVAERKVNDASAEEHTSYGGVGNTSAQNTASEQNFTLGILKMSAGSNMSFRLNTGRNVIGRKASSSGASIQIPTDSLRLSREHLVIEVKKVQGKGFVHYVSLAKERVNDTYVNNELVEFGDCTILKHGDLIKLPDTTLIFEIQDGEATEF